MMPSRDVVRDLLPLYAAGEASPDTVKFVDQALAADPVLAAEAEAFRRASPSAAPAPVRTVDQDRVALVRIREAVRTRSVLLGTAIALSLAPFAFLYEGGQVKLFALRDAPGMAIPALVAAAGCWVGWVLLGRRISRGA
jgi:anti-sigma factor RsiW